MVKNIEIDKNYKNSLGKSHLVPSICMGGWGRGETIIIMLRYWRTNTEIPKIIVVVLKSL